MYVWKRQYYGFGRGGLARNEATSCLGLQEDHVALLCGASLWLMPFLNMGNIEVAKVLSLRWALSIVFVS